MLNLNASTLACTLLVETGGTFTNNGMVQIEDATYQTTLQGKSGQANFVGNGINFNAKKLLMNNINYQPDLTLGASETLELNGGNCDFTNMSIGSGGSFIDGGNTYVISGDFDNANGTLNATGTANSQEQSNITTGGTVATKQWHNLTITAQARQPKWKFIYKRQP